MEYNEHEWEQETEIGRRLFIYNYAIVGKELPGWELVKVVVMQDDPGTKDKVYLWKKKNTEKELVRMSIIETHYWRHAQQSLKDQLNNCMRPDIPRGSGKAGKIGDIVYIAGDRNSKEISTVFFTRGNLQITVKSVGEKTVDVVALTKKIDGRFVTPPTKTEQKRGEATVSEVTTVAATKSKPVVLFDTLPEPISRSGWTRISAPDGELRRHGDMLYWIPDKDGRKKIETVRFVID